MQEMDGPQDSHKSSDVFDMFVQKAFIQIMRHIFQSFSSISLSTKIGDLPQK
jgi:hypothetical protein